MDNDLILRQFEEIEQRVERLMNSVKSLESTNADLNEKVIQLEEALQAKAETERIYSEEKALVRSKIDGLLAKLENVPAL